MTGITPPRGSAPFHWHYLASGPQAIQLPRGGEMGRFKLGSTVILLFGADAIRFATGLDEAEPVRLGQPFAHPCS